MNIHNKPRTIYFARNGQSIVEHSYKADSDLAAAGWDYAEYVCCLVFFVLHLPNTAPASWPISSWTNSARSARRGASQERLRMTESSRWVDSYSCSTKLTSHCITSHYTGLDIYSPSLISLRMAIREIGL